MTCQVRPRAGQDSDVDEAALRRLLDDVRSGIVDPDDAVAALRRLPFADLGFARVDHHRALRQGLPEAVYGPGKTAEQCAAIVAELLDARHAVPCCSPASTTHRPSAALAANPGGTSAPAPRSCGARSTPSGPSASLVVTAGTADLPVADECAAMLAAHGVHARPASPTSASPASTACSPHVDELADADAVVVVAGMEGALASVVGGLTPAPVVAVPTSVGYGAGLEGVTALLAMLASCAAGVTVVGIDNGFGAACAACACARCTTDRDRRSRDERRLVPLLLRHRRRHGARRARRRRRRPRRGPRAAASGSRSAAGRSRPSRSCAAASAATQVIVHAEETAVVRTSAHIAGLIEEARLPDRVRRPRARHLRAPSPRPRAASTAVRPSRCTSTRSAGSTPSSTSSARAPRSRCSTSTRCTPVPVAHGHRAWSAAAHGLLPNPAPAVVELLRGAPTYGRRRRRRAHHADRRGAARRARHAAGGRCRR